MHSLTTKLKEKTKNSTYFRWIYDLCKTIFLAYIYVRGWYRSNIVHKLSIAGRNIRGRRETKSLQQFKDKHKGERLFIIASGPSLRKEDVEKLRDEKTLAVNSVILMCDEINWKPTYYCISDGNVFKLLCDELNCIGLKDIFMPVDFMKYKNKMKYDPHWFEIQSWGVPSLDKPEKILKRTRFSDDIYKHGVYAVRSVTYNALQIAAYMGFSEIYLLGVDNFYEKGKEHFRNDGYLDHSRWSDAGRKEFVTANEISYRIANEYANRNGFKIFNVTRGGKLEVFERKNLDDVLFSSDQ